MTYRISSPTMIIDALKEPFREMPITPLFREALSHLRANFLFLPALSNLPSESIYAGLKLFFVLDESAMLNNAFGTVSYMLPIDVYLNNHRTYKV